MTPDVQPAASREWFFDEAGQRRGPFSESEMVEFIRAGRITTGVTVWKSSFSDWLEVEKTSLAPHLQGIALPPPLRSQRVNNTIVWVLAFAPIIGSILEYIFAYAINPNPFFAQLAYKSGNYWYITLALNIGLSYLDDWQLRKQDIDTGNLTALAFLVPVYLYQRARLLKHNMAYFIAWIVTFIVSLGL